MASRKLHIGGKETKEGWEIFDANPNPGVDHVGNANDLRRFADNTFEAVYASHVIEHFDYKDELLATLREWYRVLTPGGKLYVSAPDMDALCALFIRPDLTLEQRYHVMRMIFGGHIDQWDYHKVGLNQDILATFLGSCGFGKMYRAENFGIFQDTSAMVFAGVPISVNIVAVK